MRFGHDGKLYGNPLFGGANDQGTLFAYDPATDMIAVLADLDSGEFSYASGNVAFGTHGRIFGTTNGGGRYGFGSVYSYTPGNGLHTEASFRRNDRIGAISYGGLTVGPDGWVSGTTEQANHGGGTVYRFTTVPEPGSLAWAAPGVAGVIALRRRGAQLEGKRV